MTDQVPHKCRRAEVYIYVYKSLTQYLKRCEKMEDLDVERKLLMNIIETGWDLWIGLIWLKIGTNCGFL
jgi:hypothetical protein